jgi:hypothetical protein
LIEFNLHFEELESFLTFPERMILLALQDDFLVIAVDYYHILMQSILEDLLLRIALRNYDQQRVVIEFLHYLSGE